MPHSIRAKFVCLSVTKTVFTSEVKLQATSRNDPNSSEDKAFWLATPAGQISMTIRNDAAEGFQPGQTFYVDFTPIENE